jgi:hypothetical protein
VSLAVDASSPTAAIGSGATTVTAAFTPPDNTLCVAYCQGDANSGALDEDQTVTDSTSTTWTKKVLRNANGGACVTVHYRRIVGTSPGSITATLTDNKGSVAKRIFVRVYIDAATGIAPDIGATAVSGTSSVGLTTTVNGAWVWSTALAANATLTAGAGCTQQDEFGGFDSGDAVQTESQTSTTATAGTSVTNGLSGTATVPHNVAIEIIPGSAGGASTTPGPTVVSSLAARPVPPSPILLRSTLQDPPVLTTAQPLVVSRPAVVVPGVAAVLRSSLVDVVAATGSTPQPIVVTSTRPVAVPPALVLRATLADPPTLTTPQPVVVTSPARVVPGAVMTLRSSLADAVVVSSAPTQPLIVAPAAGRPPVPPPTIARSTLIDPPVLTTTGPTVIAATPVPAPGVVTLLRSSLVDTVVVSSATPQPLVIVPSPPPAIVTPPYIARSTLADPPVLTTAQPIVVTPAVKPQPRPPILLRSPSLADLATPGPIVVTGPVPAQRSTVMLLRSPQPAVVVVGQATPQPIVVATPQPRQAGRLLLLHAPVSATCDCTTHRPNTGTTTRASTGTTARPSTGTTTRPCSC